MAQWSGRVVEWWCDALGCHGWQRTATRLCQKLGGDTAGRELPGNYGAFWGQNAGVAAPVGRSLAVGGMNWALGGACGMRRAAMGHKKGS